MLHAFRAQLKQLAQDPHDPFLSTVRKIVGPRAAAHYAAPLRKMILALPEMIEGLRRSTDQHSLDPSVRRLQNFALTYLYSPTDYLPEKSFGLFGYLDDAYLVANVYERTLNEMSARGLKINSAYKIKGEDVRRWIDMARHLLPNEMISIEQSLHDVGKRTGRGFGSEILKAGKAGPASPVLKRMVK